MRIFSLGMVVLAGCGTGTAVQESRASVAPTPGSAAPAPGSAAPVSRAVTVECQGYTDQAARACAAKPGCSYGSPIWCSGVPPRPEDLEQLRAGPCRCTCQAEREDCGSRP